MKTRIASRALNTQIGYRIKLARKRAGRDQSELARAIGHASPTSVHMMEAGAKMIRASDLALIAEFLKCTIRSLFPKGSVR